MLLQATEDGIVDGLIPCSWKHDLNPVRNWPTNTSIVGLSLLAMRMAQLLIDHLGRGTLSSSQWLLSHFWRNRNNLFDIRRGRWSCMEIRQCYQRFKGSGHEPNYIF